MSDYPPPPPPPPGQTPWGPPPAPPQWGQAPGPPPGPPPGWAPPGQQWSPPTGSWGAPGGRRYAGFGARLAAAIIDGLLLTPITIVAWIVLAAGPKTNRACSFDAYATCRGPSGAAFGLAFLIWIGGFVGSVLYFGLMDGRTGQTLGKRVVSIRVVDAYTGAPIGVGRAIGRYFGRFISGLACYLGFLWMLWDPNKQTWHDKMVNAYVVSE